MEKSALIPIAVLWATPAVAEVSDKVLSKPGMWVQAVIIGVIAILLGRIRWWLALPLAVLPVVLVLGTVGLRHGTFIGRAVLEEQGEVYFTHSYASAALAAILVGAGIWNGWRRRKRAG